MSDDMTLDFSDVKPASGFSPLPKGWYNVIVSDWATAEVGPNAKTMAPGTPGTTYELTVEDGPSENRKLWANFWHAKSSLPYWKQFLIASGAFTEDELNGLNLADEAGLEKVRENPLGKSLQVKVKIRRQKEYDDSNQIQDYAPEGTNKVVQEKGSSSGSGSDTSWLP